VQHNCSSDRKHYGKLEDVPIRHEYCVVFKKTAEARKEGGLPLRCPPEQALTCTCNSPYGRSSSRLSWLPSSLSSWP
jgi:hypothetical protein